MLPLRQSSSRAKDELPIQEDHQTRFYKGYLKVADEYDNEFFDKYDEDLNTTLIFVSLVSSCGEYANQGVRPVFSPL